MENASKALIIAGGILIGLMLLAAFVYLFSQMSEYSELQDKQKLEEQIVEFNKPYEAYQRNLLRGSDIISICNRANDYNKRNEGRIGDNEIIKITVTFAKSIGDSWASYQNKTVDMIPIVETLKKGTEKFDDFTRRYFMCDGIDYKIHYDSTTGKVNGIDFKERTEEEVFKIK